MDPRNEMQTECEDNETVIDPFRHFSSSFDLILLLGTHPPGDRDASAPRVC